jgi:hypothetical protein
MPIRNHKIVTINRREANECMNPPVPRQGLVSQPVEVHVSVRPVDGSFGFGDGQPRTSRSPMKAQSKAAWRRLDGHPTLAHDVCT